MEDILRKIISAAFPVLLTLIISIGFNNVVKTLAVEKVAVECMKIVRQTPENVPDQCIKIKELFE